MSESRSPLESAVVVAAGAVLLLLLGAVLWQVVRDPEVPQELGTTSSASRSDSPGAAAPEAGELSTHVDRRERARQILDDWDRRRAEAWAAGDVVRLGGLYARDSAAGDTDAARLSAYLDRGLVVRRMVRQTLAFELVRFGPRRLVVRVTDRLADAEAVDRRGHRWSLPRGQASSYRLVLVRRTGSWVVARSV